MCELSRHINGDGEEDADAESAGDEIFESGTIICGTAREISIFCQIIFDVEIEGNEIVKEEANANTNYASKLSAFEVVVLGVIACGISGTTGRTHHNGSKSTGNVEIIIEDPFEQ